MNCEVSDHNYKIVYFTFIGEIEAFLGEARWKWAILLDTMIL